MTYKARTKKKNVDENSDHLFIPKGGISISSPNIRSCRRSPRIKTVTAIYESDDSSTSSQLELNSGDNSSCNSYPIKLESIEEVDDTFSSNILDDMGEKYIVKKRKASNSTAWDHSPVRQKEDGTDLDEPLISLKLNKGKKRRKLFKSTEGSSVDMVRISEDPTSQKSDSVTETVDKNVEVVLDKNIFDSGISASTHSLNSEIVEICDKVNCNMEVNHLTDISTSVGEIKGSVAAINSVESNSPHHVSISDEHINPSVEDYDSSDKINLSFEGVLDNRDDTTILIQPHDTCVVEPMKNDSQTRIMQINEEHFENGRSTDMSVPPSYSESNTWTSSTNDWQLDTSKGSYDGIVYHNQKNCVNEFSSINNCKEFRIGNQEEAVVQETCNFGVASVYKDVGSLDSLVFQALCGDAHINNHESQVQLTVENNKSVEAYGSSHPSDAFSSPCDLHSIAISSLENSGSSSAEIQILNNVVDRLSNTANNVHSSTEMKLNLVEGQELNNQNELKCNQEANDEDQNYPKNLLQNRKDLPPKSQEKLCWYDNELDDTIKVFGHMADSMQSPEITRRRLKRSKKLPQLPSSKEHLKPKDGSDGNYISIQATTNIQSQKAVLFSQRQMQDIESIASKLLKEMSFLKNIVTDIMNNDNVGSGSCLLPTSKFAPEEINAAVGNASTLEATTKKWLAMMSKDCTRFCKIMSSTESNISTPVSIASKQSRKVSFADEAGGSLCHVKVFEQPPAADIQVESENGNMTAT